MELTKYYLTVTLVCFVVIAEAVRSAKNSEVAMAFKKARIVPDIIKEAPASKLKVWWDTSSVELGNNICLLRTIIPPRIEFDTVPGKYYTLVYFDADAPSSAAPVDRNYLLRLDVNIPSSNLYGGFTVAPRIPPIATPGSGVHRCVTLAFEQPRLIDVYNANLTQYGVSRMKFSMDQASTLLGLGAPIAGNFFTTYTPNYFDDQYCKACTTCNN